MSEDGPCQTNQLSLAHTQIASTKVHNRSKAPHARNWLTKLHLEGASAHEIECQTISSYQFITIHWGRLPKVNMKVRIYLVKCLPNVIIRVFVKWVKIVTHGSREQRGVLRNYGKRLAQRGERHAISGAVVDKDGPIRGRQAEKNRE